ncbi:hypothetical protein ACN28S_22550 [Cystobacter fuscus]
MMRSSLTRLLLLGVALAFVAACPRSRPPSDSPELDAGVDGGDTSLACALPEPADAGVPWRESCALRQPIDPCSQLVLPDAGPVPTADRWCEDSARIRCAAWVDAGSVDPTAEAGCAQFEGARCASSFPASLVDAGYLSYWPAAAWECLRGAGPPDSPACGCAFVRGGLGAPCANDVNCRSGYCLKDASDAGTCVECPPLRPLGSPCGRAEGDAPCDRDGTCAQGCCVPRPTTGESCGGRPYVSCHPDTSTCSDTCIETCGGGICRAHKGVGEVCGLDPFCGLRPRQLCNLGTCGPGLVCTYVSSEPSSYAQCQPTGIRCDGNWSGCARGRCAPPPSAAASSRTRSGRVRRARGRGSARRAGVPRRRRGQRRAPRVHRRPAG